MSKKLLDYEGLSTVISKLKEIFPLKSETATKNYVNSITGALSNLSTQDKATLVNAINELVSKDIPIINWNQGFDVKNSATGIYQLGSGCKNLFWTGRFGWSDTFTGVTLIKINIDSSTNFAIFFQTRNQMYGTGVNKGNIYVYGDVNGTSLQYNYYLLSTDAQGISGVKTFSSIPQISNNLTPTSNNHLVNKKYVDEAIAGIDLSNYLAKDNEDEFVPEGDYNPSTKKYVDDNFFRGNNSEWEALTDEEKASYAIAVVSPGYVELTAGDLANIQTAVGEELDIESDMVLEDALEAALNIAGESEE